MQRKDTVGTSAMGQFIKTLVLIILIDILDFSNGRYLPKIGNCINRYLFFEIPNNLLAKTENSQNVNELIFEMETSAKHVSQANIGTT